MTVLKMSDKTANVVRKAVCWLVGAAVLLGYAGLVDSVVGTESPLGQWIIGLPGPILAAVVTIWLMLTPYREGDTREGRRASMGAYFCFGFPLLFLIGWCWP